MPTKTKEAPQRSTGSASQKPIPTDSMAISDSVSQVPGSEPPAGMLPEWLTDMPMPSCYSLTMNDTNGDNVNDVLLNRAEFKALKIELARMRGFVVPDEIEDNYDLEADAVVSNVHSTAQNPPCPSSLSDRHSEAAATSPELKAAEVREEGETISFTDLSKCGIEFMKVCREIYDNHGGFTTPFEELITGLVLDYENRQGTAEFVEHRMESFKENIGEVTRDCTLFLAQNKALAKEIADKVNA